MKEDRKEYLKNYRLTHKEQYRKYSKKYRENNITTYERLKQENEQLRLILGNQVRIKDELSKKRDIAIGILKTWKDYCEVNLKNDKNHWIYCIEKIEVLEEVLEGSGVNE